MIKKVIYFSVFIYFLVEPNCHAMPSLEVGGQITSAVLELNAASNYYRQVKKGIIDIETGNSPQISGQLGLENLEKLYKSLEKGVNETEEIPIIDFNSYVISHDDLTNCFHRETTKTKLDDFEKAFNDKINEGNDAISRVSSIIEKLSEHQKDLHEIKEVFKKTVSIPVYQNFFIFDWYVLESRVGPALGLSISKIKSRKKRIEEETERLKLEYGNLKNNRVLLSNTCNMKAAFSGTCTNQDQFTITLTNQLSSLSYSGFYRIIMSDGDQGEGLIPEFAISGDGVIKGRFSNNGEIIVFNGSIDKYFNNISIHNVESDEEGDFRCDSLKRQ